MLETIQQLINDFNTYAMKYKFVAGALSIWGLGVATFFLRSVPLQIYGVIKKQCTTTLHLTSCHESFHNFLKWIEKNGYADKVRKIKVSNGRYGTSDKSVTGVGYGNHYIWYKCRCFKINLSKESSSDSNDKETLTITKLGRSVKIFKDIVTQSELKEDGCNIFKLYEWRDWWSYVNDQPKRDLDSVYLEKEKKDLLKNTIQRFYDNEEWYRKNGIPYRLGILLHGPPGTGKTSLIKSLISEFDKDLFLFKNTAELTKGISQLPEMSICIVEDIDGMNGTEKRTDESDENLGAVEKLNKASGNISALLNSIDGISDSYGRILIMTTNYPEKLDPALLRPGRIDLSLEISYCNNEILELFYKNFFPNFKLPKNFKIKEKISPAQIQNDIILINDPQKILDKIRG